MKFSDDYIDVLLKIGETKTNLVADSRYILNMEEEYLGKNKVTTIVPINGNRERLGTLITVTLDKEYSDEDIVLMEYSATIIGLEILRSKQLLSEENQRKNDVVDLAINTLSYIDKEAVNHIFKELNGPEGLLVASRIADKPFLRC